MTPRLAAVLAAVVVAAAAGIGVPLASSGTDRPPLRGPIQLPPGAEAVDDAATVPRTPQPVRPAPVAPRDENARTDLDDQDDAGGGGGGDDTDDGRGAGRAGGGGDDSSDDGAASSDD